MYEVKVSVRNLVEFILRQGDIDDSKGVGLNKDAMNEGSKIHRKIQKKMGSNYRAEVPLSIDVEYEEIKITVEGRADGIITLDDGFAIDEIKGMYVDVLRLEEPYMIHLAQAMCYGYIYSKENALDTIDIQLTYCNLETEMIKRFKEAYSMEYLTDWFTKLVDKYYVWALYDMENKASVRESAKTLEFPFEYRSHQRDMVASVYSAIKRKNNLFVQAPTGIGKTMATVFPAIKAVGENLGEKIFYLTAKTVTAAVAMNAYDTLRKNNMLIKTIAITAKEKICPMEVMACNPDNCPYAKGHYDRINDAVYDLVTKEYAITREVILEYADKHQVCPFEMSLDASLWVTGIICDYNYVFDPRASLKRYFADGIKGEYIFLVDEAHNLIERARTMYSAVLYKEDFLKIRRIVADKSPKLAKYLNKCNKDLLEFKKKCEDIIELESIGSLSLSLMSLVAEYENFLDEYKNFDGRDEVLDFYFQLLTFTGIYERVDDSYIIYAQNKETSFSLNLFCVNPAKNLTLCLNKGNSTTFFSATMLPIKYYKELLSNNPKDYAIYIPSPFKQENRGIYVGSDVSSRYKRRGPKEYEKIYTYINKAIAAHQGNYMVFFPSYRMLEDVYEVAISYGLDSRCNLIKQEANMREQEKEEFLSVFDDVNSNTVAFCIMGGIFSEGIDLTEEKLIGAIVVGTGLPMVCQERNLIMEYFNRNGGLNGFEYAYLYPGMNKVLQAAGRVIRTETDIGVILLLDERFLSREYSYMFPEEWNDYRIANVNNAETLINEFWDNIS